MKFFDFFKSSPRSLFLDFSPQEAHWHVVTWNFDLKNLQHRLWTLEIQDQHSQIIEWSKTNDEEIRFFKKDKLVKSQGTKSKREELRDLMNVSIHATLKHGLDLYKDFLLEPYPGAKSTDYQTEMRSLQWIQASFGTLIRALDQLKTRPDLILTAAVFSGLEPQTGLKVLRVMAFNLDIFCYFQDDMSLQLTIFDDKSLGHGGAKSPTFQQIIKVTKPQIYDEIIKLVHKIATAGEIV
jgi:hypothetical protein